MCEGLSKIHTPHSIRVLFFGRLNKLYTREAQICPRLVRASETWIYALAIYLAANDANLWAPEMSMIGRMEREVSRVGAKLHLHSRPHGVVVVGMWRGLSSIV